HVTQAVLPGMKQRQQGHIINMGSVAGQQAYANGSVYCATKAAVASITKSLMMETVDTPIRISEINPGKEERNLYLLYYCQWLEFFNFIFIDHSDVCYMIIFIL